MRDPDVQEAAEVDPAPSKSSFSSTTSGSQEIVGAGVPLVGAVEGLPGDTVGTPVVGNAVVGLALGVPRMTVGLEVVGIAVEGANVVGGTVVGKPDGLPGVTVG